MDSGSVYVHKYAGLRRRIDTLQRKERRSARSQRLGACYRHPLRRPNDAGSVPKCQEKIVRARRWGHPDTQKGTPTFANGDVHFCQKCTSPFATPATVSRMIFRIGSTLAGVTDNSSTPIFTNVSVSVVSAPSSPQIPTQHPLLCPFSMVI